MNKKRIIELLEPLGLCKHEYCVLSSGALVMYGVLEEAGDLDLVVDENGFEKIKKVYPDILKREDGWYTVTDEIEIVIGCVKKTFCNGYPLQSIKELVEFYETRGLEKDKVRIFEINNFFKNKVQI